MFTLKGVVIFFVGKSARMANLIVLKASAALIMSLIIPPRKTSKVRLKQPVP